MSSFCGCVKASVVYCLPAQVLIEGVFLGRRSPKKKKGYGADFYDDALSRHYDGAETWACPSPKKKQMRYGCVTFSLQPVFSH